MFYHKNIDAIYKKEWIDRCVLSIADQTLVEFDVFEMDYGGTEKQYAKYVRKNYHFFNENLENHIESMNILISKVFEMGYDVVFNTNLDDFFHHDRFALQLQAIEEGYQLVSSNWHYIDENNNVTKVFRYHNHDIEHELLIKNHNIIAHPCVAMHRSFWTDDLYYDNILGREDKILWQKALQRGKKFKILEEPLLMYRLHSNQVTKTYKK
ncbi:MAG TPA: hypothetical protein ACFYEK_01090 [Candidatus Wunengus sp. YC60]|uniref:hypothetical protein n=1 Tax=Candidatus Wunengus sp. YC60 TaxID=3367697 RepID=UPI004025404A